MASKRRGNGRDGTGRAPVTVEVTIIPDAPRTPAWAALWRRLLAPTPAEVAHPVAQPVAQQEAEAAAQPARERSADHGW